MIRPRVMVWDDDARLVGEIVSALDARGVDAVPLADRPLESGGAPSPNTDFAMLDVSLPRRGGLVFVPALADARIPFLFLSNSDDDALTTLAVETGAMACFHKPLDLHAVVASIRTWIARAAELENLRRERDSLLDALGRQRQIGTAVGVIMQRHGVSAESAFDALRRHARHERTSVAMLAKAVVTGTASVQPAQPVD